VTDAQKFDRADTRVRADEGLLGAVRGMIDRIRSGDLGVLPVIVGLIVITVVFTWLNPVFVRPANLTNLLFDAAAVGLISLGVVFCLLLGEIDLSIGSMSGVSSALLGLLWVNVGLPWPIAIVAALMAGASVGLVYALLRNKLGMPSFVATLAGLLALLGVQLWLLGNSGSINLPFQSFLIRFGQILVVPAWLSYVLALVPGAAILILGTRTRKERATANLSAPSLGVLLVKSLGLTAIILAAVWYLNQGRGAPFMFVFFVLLVAGMEYLLTHTKWGRAVFAVGGNMEAARRAGINVEQIRITCFMLCATFAAAGGVLAASRLASASRQAGTGDVNLNAIAAAGIGGTSLFGGRGSAWSALLGVLVIVAISNGLTLLNLSSAFRFMITGAVLAIAVIVDSLARQSRSSHGRA